MKKLSFILLIIISVNCFSQKEDSILSVEVNKYLDTLIKKTPISELRVFLYKSASAEKYDEFMQFYNLFINTKGNEWIKRKKKQ